MGERNDGTFYEPINGNPTTMPQWTEGNIFPSLSSGAEDNPYADLGQNPDKAGTSDDLVNQWAQSTGAPTDIPPDVLAAIKSGQNGVSQAGGRVFADINGQIQDISPFVNQFKDWVTSNASQYAQWSQYATLAQGQPGRDSTILTGAAIAPQTAAMEASMGMGGVGIPTAASPAVSSAFKTGPGVQQR
jgi:hypothetical protein